MKNHALSVGALVFGCLLASATQLECGFPGLGGPVLGFGGSELSGETLLTSTSLSSAEAAARGLIAAQEEPVEGVGITPTNVTGKVLSLLFATDGEIDEGLVVFGDSRPDIAPASSALIDFDFDAPQLIFSSINLKPGYVGGQSSLMVLLFGYLDMHFDLNGEPRVMRVATADVEGMTRGDKLLQNATTGDFEWYDLDAGAFTSTRPANPAAIEAIRDFTDPIRPNLVFYPVNALVLVPIQLDPNALAAASAVHSVIDFLMNNAITLVGETTTIDMTDATLITSFDLTQNASGFDNSGFVVDATISLVSIQPNPFP